MTRLTLTAALMASTVLGTQAHAAKITRIELGQAGIARYTMLGETLDTTLRFDVPQAASDDVLASLIVRDPAGGVIDLQTDTPGSTGRALRETVFAGGMPTTTEGLLRALTGDQITLTTERGTWTGRLMGVDSTDVIEGKQAIARATALLLGASGVTEIVLTPGTRVDFAEASAERLAQAMDADQGNAAMRVFDLTLEGTGPRQIDLSYVTEAAAWKNSWRLLLDEGRLQGWATLENVSGKDWSDVALTLTTGAPVAFRRNLIDPLFIARADPGDVTPRPIMAAADGGAMAGMLFSAAPTAEMDAPRRKAASGAARAGAQVQTSGILRYDLPEPLDLANGRTANLMYIDLPIEPQLRGLYRPRETAGTVILAASIQSDQALASGLVSVQDDKGFVGDALFDGMLAGQTRLLPFAVAPGSQVLTDSRESRRIEGVAVSDQGLTVTIAQTRTTVYETELPDNVALFSVEHPTGYGDLDEASGTVERGDGFVRASVPVVEGKGRAQFVESARRNAVYRFDSDALSALLLEVRNGNLDASPAMKEAFVQARQILHSSESLRDEGAELRNRYSTLVEEQKRLRENLEAVTQDALRTRYIDSLDRTETEIGATLDALDSLRAEEATLRDRFTAVFKDL